MGLCHRMNNSSRLSNLLNRCVRPLIVKGGLSQIIFPFSNGHNVLLRSFGFQTNENRARNKSVPSNVSLFELHRIEGKSTRIKLMLQFNNRNRSNKY